MDDGVAIAIGVGAVLVVWFVTKKQEQQTAMQAGRILHDKANDTLGAGDTTAGFAAGLATYFGGPKAGQAVLSVSGKRL